jgi:RNA polymerase primary sigma factor
MRHIELTRAIAVKETRSVGAYFTDIGKTMPLSPQEEVRLAQRIRRGDRAALDRLVRANLRFVVTVAKKYQYQGLALPDLISEGNIGLIEAAGRFDESRGFKFISFAVWWIRQYIVAALAEQTRTIRLPMPKTKEITKIHQAAALLEQQTMREPSSAQLAGYLGLREEKIRETLSAAQRTASLDQLPGEGDEYALADRIPSPDYAADAPLMAESFQQEIGLLLSRLSARERQVIELSYGLTGGLDMCPADIAPHTGLSTERVRQIRKEAMAKLRLAKL